MEQSAHHQHLVIDLLPVAQRERTGEHRGAQRVPQQDRWLRRCSLLGLAHHPAVRQVADAGQVDGCGATPANTLGEEFTLGMQRLDEHSPSLRCGEPTPGGGHPPRAAETVRVRQAPGAAAMGRNRTHWDVPFLAR